MTDSSPQVSTVGVALFIAALEIRDGPGLQNAKKSTACLG